MQVYIVAGGETSCLTSSGAPMVSSQRLRNCNKETRVSTLLKDGGTEWVDVAKLGGGSPANRMAEIHGMRGVSLDGGNFVSSGRR